MPNELARTYEVDGQEITLNPGVLARYVLGGNAGNVSEPEMAKAIMTCAARKLNPFAGDVHFLPHYDKDTQSTKLSICPSIDYYQRRAMAHSKYRGIQDGVVILAGGVLTKKNGCAIYQELNETLVGGWAAVYVDGYEKPVYAEASLKEYNQHRSLWLSKPATMINKVAKSQALRKAFPDMFGGLYEPSEIGEEAPEASCAPVHADGQSWTPCEAEYEVVESQQPAVFAEAPQESEAAAACGQDAPQGFRGSF